MRTLLCDLLSCLPNRRLAILASFCTVMFTVAGTAHGDFATSGRLNARNSKTIFHGGGLFQPQASPRGAAQQPTATDPFLDYGGRTVEPQAPVENRAPEVGASEQPAAQTADSQAASGWIHPSIVRVRVEEEDGLANGSGTLIGVDEKHGYVITNWHVVRGASGQITIEFPDGFRSAATVVKMDEEWDLAALVIWKPKALPMPLSPRLPERGEPLIIAGYGQGSFRSAQGTMTEFVAPTKQSPFEMFEVSTAARQGDSGGPIVNMQGQLAGVLFGAGDGRTTGSHVGRLRAFLDEAFRPPGQEAGGVDRSQVASGLPAAPEVRVAAQQPAAFHQPENEMDALARQAAAGLPSQPQVAGGDVDVYIPNELPGELVAQAPTATATAVPQVIGGEVSDDFLAGIPIADPVEFRMASRRGLAAYGSGSSATAVGLPTAGPRGSGNDMGDLKTYLALFGVFAVVFCLLPRDRR